jgi:hypothetical protein
VPTDALVRSLKGILYCQLLDSVFAQCARRFARLLIATEEGRMPKVLLFDTWGTLVDNYSIADVIEPHVFEAHCAKDRPGLAPPPEVGDVLYDALRQFRWPPAP